MGLDAIADLFKVVEYTAKKMLRSIFIPSTYTFLSILFTVSIALSFLLPLTDQLTYFITLITGLIGSTILSAYLSLLIYFVDKHLELSKYYYSNIRDLLSNIKSSKDIEKLEERVEKLLLVSKIGIEYSPVTIIPAYTALLLLHDKLYSILLFTIYMIICGVVYYKVVELFNTHLKLENSVEEEIFNLIGIKDRRNYELYHYNYLKLVLSIITYAILLSIYMVKFIKDMDRHIANHRCNYEYVKNYVIKLFPPQYPYH